MSMINCRKIFNQENGQAVVLVSVAFAFLAILVGLAADGGRMYLGKGRVDRIADAAALAGARALAANDGDATLAAAAACDLARLNSPSNESGGGGCPPGVVVSVQGVTKPDGSVQDGVVVTVTETMNTTFMRFGTFFGCGDDCRQVHLSSRQSSAIAFVEPACIYALNETAPQALRLNGSASIGSPNCGIYVRSASADAVHLNGTTSIDAGGPVNIVGGVSASSNANIHPTPRTGAPWQADPLASLPVPPAGGSCQNQPSGSDKSFTPGRYCTLDLTGNGTINFAPGVYYIDNGFTAKGNVTVTGQGVTFYIAGGAVTITGNSTVNLRAPTSGTYEGITIFQNRTNTEGATITGSTNLTIGGLYFAGAQLEYSGGSCQPNTGMLMVADTILISGSTCVSMPDALPPNLPRTAALVR